MVFYDHDRCCSKNAYIIDGEIGHCRKVDLINLHNTALQTCDQLWSYILLSNILNLDFDIFITCLWMTLSSWLEKLCSISLAHTFKKWPRQILLLPTCTSSQVHHIHTPRASEVDPMVKKRIFLGIRDLQSTEKKRRPFFYFLEREQNT